MCRDELLFQPWMEALFPAAAAAAALPAAAEPSEEEEEASGSEDEESTPAADTLFGSADVDAQVREGVSAAASALRHAEARRHRNAAPILAEHGQDALVMLQAVTEHSAEAQRAARAAELTTRIHEERAAHVGFNNAFEGFSNALETFSEASPDALPNPLRPPPGARSREEGVLRSESELAKLEEKRLAFVRQMQLILVKYQDVATKIAHKRYEHISHELVVESASSAQHTRDVNALHQRLNPAQRRRTRAQMTG